MQLIHEHPASMHSSLIPSTDHDPLKSLALDYLNLFSHGAAAFSDVVFLVEGKQLHAHRCILAARSSFFRMVFGKGMDDDHSPGAVGALTNDFRTATGPSLPLQIPVGIVGYDVFIILLQFLYGGQLILAFQQGQSKCTERGCWHAHCSSHVELALDTLHAATFFGVDQLSIMVQRYLGSIVEKISIDDVMRVLVAAKKQGLHTLWTTCSELVAKSGLALETLKKHLPQDIATEIEEIRIQKDCSHRNDFLYYVNHSCTSAILSSIERGMTSATVPAPTAMHQQRIRKMRQALDSQDVELVRLMVMGEGLDLDNAHALHYSVSNCSRDVVKALLEMGAVNVNHPDEGGRTALHIACDMASPDMISVLLDHHALPLLRSDNGDTPVDIIQGLMSTSHSSSPMQQSKHHGDQNKLRLCLELLQSAAHVADKEDNFSDGVITEPSSDNTSCKSMYLQHHHPCMDIPDCSSSFDPLTACSAAIATPMSLHADWGSIESCCSLEQDLLNPANLDSNNHHHQSIHDHIINLSRRDSTRQENKGESPGDIIDHDGHAGFDNTVNGSVHAHVQMCPQTPSGNIGSFMISSNMDGFLYPDFRMANMAPETRINTTIF